MRARKPCSAARSRGGYQVNGALLADVQRPAEMLAVHAPCGKRRSMAVER
jgi:hypothetical protein